MGMFSWLTADTQVSIANVHSGRVLETVYLIQPKGNPPLKQDKYDGYGLIGMDCYEWLALINFGDSNKRGLAINAECGHYYEGEDSYFACSMHVSESELRCVVKDKNKKITLFANYAEQINQGMTANDFIKQKKWQERTTELTFPLKFSHDPNAIYETLPASKVCPHQGFFYD